MPSKAVQPGKRRAPAAPAAPVADGGDRKRSSRKTKQQQPAPAAAAEIADGGGGGAAKEDEEEDEEDSSSSSSDVDSDEDAIDLSLAAEVKKEDLLQIEFEFYDLNEGDFHSVKQLLFHKLPGLCEGANLSGATDAIVDQPEVGLLVRVAGTDHVFGVTTALPAALHRQKDFWQAIEAKLVSACPSDKAAVFKAALASPGLGACVFAAGALFFSFLRFVNAEVDGSRRIWRPAAVFVLLFLFCWRATRGHSILPFPFPVDLSHVMVVIVISCLCYWSWLSLLL